VDEGVDAEGGSGSTYDVFVVGRSIDQRVVITTVGALVGAALSAGLGFVMAVTDTSDVRRIVAVVVGLVGLAICRALIRLRTPPPLWALDSMLVALEAASCGLALVDQTFLLALPVTYVVLAGGVFVVRRLSASIGHLALMGVCYAVALGFGPPVPAPLTRWVAVMASVVIVGFFVRWLVDLVRRAAEVEHDTRREVERTIRELDRLSTAKSSFLSRMSHELRTPLNVILGFSDVLRDQMFGTLNPVQLGYLDDITTSGRDLLGLVDELLDVSKVEHGSIDLHPIELDVAHAVADARLLVEHRARQAAVTIEIVSPSDPAVVRADARKVRQVVWNLLGNAVKYSPAGGTVLVTIERAESSVLVSVRDSGPGISSVDQDRIFDAYEQGKDAAEGSGLGLSLCRRFIQAHGGRLWVESAPRLGSVFTFELPLSTSDESSRSGPSSITNDRTRLWLHPSAPLNDEFTVPGSPANQAVMALVGRWFAGAAAITLAVLAVITPGPAIGRISALLLSLGALLIAAMLRRRPTNALEQDLLGGFGIVAVSVGTLVAGSYSDLVPLAYCWSVLAANILLTRHRAIRKTLFVALCYGAVLAIDRPPDALARWGVIMTLLVANTFVIGWLADRLREVVLENQQARLEAEAVAAAAAAMSKHKADFLAHTSHELLTPLNAIIGFADVLRDGLAGPLEPRQLECIEDILASGRHLLALICDLLDLAKLEARGMSCPANPVAVAAIVQSAAGVQMPLARARQITMSVDVPVDLPLVSGDAARLTQVLTNLIANAVKFTPDRGAVSVSAEQRGDRVLIHVSDTGIGILPDQQDRLFEAFQQGTRALPHHARGGTGLGLTLARGLVELHRGDLTVESLPDVGSTFTVALPATSIETGVLV
jgi:signal transduction histidine kinase